MKQFRPQTAQSLYKGWQIYRGPAHPVTGKWRAVRFGVGMGAGNLDALKRMIDAREQERTRAEVQS